MIDTNNPLGIIGYNPDASFNESGGVLDTILKVNPIYAGMRFMKDTFDPQTRNPMSLPGRILGNQTVSQYMNNNLGFGNPFGGNTGNTDGGYGNYGFGGSPYTGGNIISSLGGGNNSLSDDTATDSGGGWSAADEQSYADEVGVADY